MTERIVLAYSGGLDTSVAIGWITEQTGAEVIALAVVPEECPTDRRDAPEHFCATPTEDVDPCQSPSPPRSHRRVQL